MSRDGKIGALATSFGVGKRSVYKALVVVRQRSDLADEVLAGRMTIHAAWQLATGKTGKPSKADTRAALHAAWRAASVAERAELIDLIADDKI